MPKYLFSFSKPTHITEQINDSDGKIIGTIRLKPNGILWKPKGQRKYRAVKLETFIEWITNNAGALIKCS